MTNQERHEEGLDALRRRVHELETENSELRRVLAGREALSGILRACAGCRKIRDGGDEWVTVEGYLSDLFDVDFSHTLCPTCEPDYGFVER